jgi:hypothetical protein
MMKGGLLSMVATRLIMKILTRSQRKNGNRKDLKDTSRYVYRLHLYALHIQDHAYRRHYYSMKATILTDFIN